MLKILIIEDEPVSPGLLNRELESISQIRRYLSFMKKFNRSRSIFRRKEVDLVLLDLSLYGEDSLSVAENLKHHNTQIIIISGRLEKAIDAFEFSVLDFVPNQ